jgi:sugar lactone lactonase YvrE
MRGLAALLLAAATAPPSVAFTIPVAHKLIEGIASDGRTFWFSSVIDRTIIAVGDGRSSEWTLPGTVGQPLGMAWDAKRRWLWIATDCLDLPGLKPCDVGALVAVDRKGRIRQRLAAPAPFHVGDVSARDGKVFVADSRNGAVYRVAGEKLVAVVSPGIGKSAQGSALSMDGNSLVVADYAQGITQVDLASGERTLVLLDGKPLRGMDGLTRAGDWYVGVQNGGSVGRLIAFRIVDGALDVKVLAEGGLLADPTQLLVTPDAILVVADSGWAIADKPGPRPARATIARFSLP